ncbi:Domain of unknown function DUF4050 [Phaffia rhodozyma]|uniref:Gag1-like clamp domain-containing protein n=1 Tax=Phaffia rhodozyma TaxID=264483 RepID=A0A0F7SG93_PHARH|nr:Domain of unknown function DUF4050 [Phaffia rhodozyma]
MERSPSSDVIPAPGQVSFFPSTTARPSFVPHSSPRSSTSSFSASPPIPGLAELNLNSDDTASTSSSPSKNAIPADPSDPNFEFGEAVFHQRRAAWLALPASRNERKEQKSPGRLGLLEEVLDELPEGNIPDDIWKGGLEGVWRGLIGGRRLANPMPLPTVIKVLKAGWIKDGTWPTNYITGPSSSPPLIPPLSAVEQPIIPPNFAPIPDALSPESNQNSGLGGSSTSISSTSTFPASTVLLGSTLK